MAENQKNEKQWLIRCEYDCYCQGYESTTGYFLVRAENFDAACDKIWTKVKDPRVFEDCTID